MEDILKNFLDQQEKILKQQAEIFASIRRIEEFQDMLNFKVQRQYDELNARLEINERSTRQIDEQLAILNTRRENELADLKVTLEKLKSLEEFLKVDIATRLIDKAVGQ